MSTSSSTTDANKELDVKILPAFRWFGSKTKSRDAILQLVPPGLEVFAEVFAGSATVLLGANPPFKDEHVNDLSKVVWNFFHVLKDDKKLDRLCHLVYLTLYSQHEFDICKSMDSDDDVELARQFVATSWMAYGPAIFQSPAWLAIDAGNNTSRYASWKRVPDRIRAVAERMRGVAVHCEDAAKFVKRFEKRADTCLFVDPPYPSSAIKTNKKTYEFDMDESEHEAFAHLLLGADCKVIMTMAKGTLYDNVLKDWVKLDLPVKGMRRSIKSETIFTNFEPRTCLLRLAER